MVVVCIRLFGTVEVSTPSRTFGPKDFPSRKAKQLCELLALEQGRWVHRDRLIEELWGDKLPQSPSAALDHTASLLRRVLRADDGSQCLRTGDGSYRIDTNAADVDVVRFEELLRLTVNEGGAAALVLLVEAAKLVDGELVADEPYASWASAAREHYRLRVERMLIDIARRALALDDPALAREISERARIASPEVFEEAYALNVSALAELGQLDEARRLMGELERRLRLEFDSEISGDTVLLRTVLRHPANRDVTFQLPVSVKTVLESAIDELLFASRDSDVRRVVEILSRNDSHYQLADTLIEHSLVVIEGPAGIGKSQILGRVLSHFDSVHLVRCVETDREQPLFIATRLVALLENSAPTSWDAVDADDGIPAASVATLFARVLRCLEHSADSIIAIEDFHCADTESIAMIAGLVQHGVRVVATRCVGASADAPSVGSEKVVSLGPLDRADVERLPLRGAWEETGGHPGMLHLCAEQPSNVPLDRDAIARVLGWIGPRTSPVRATLEAASTMKSCSIEQLASRLGLSATVTSSIIDQAQQLRLVEVATDGIVAFRGDLMRRVLQSVAKR